ncbi:acid phosphatase/Vanadium-dependent haloperoxidase [Sodiomyces alkalinus F11]|uniref:Acid phosphatase/Vanadium-dependent haloperoxidase n=1 Tax=Sodiomyces alkalinus (strain CBS 110278 / VKM F-3762 / F11) TaxID=1314773 RepID=A0A3N2PWN5_SODAK|nr:acid phosphatase/Vanadium-dependent haloperoxidase [Sodiomyces alkalinus F11]ROT38892.1 acid phosphatase/Vanadium-dependent haloperoxidase [Sodiomyces alkalinus F11]
MRFSVLLSTLAVTAITHAAPYEGDIVQLWNQQWTDMVRGGVAPSNTTLPIPILPAMIHGAMYLASVLTKDDPLLVQQAAVSVAAHGVLESIYNNSVPVQDAIDDTLETVLSELESGGCNGTDPDTATAIARASAVGRDAAAELLAKRVDPCFHEPPEYAWGPPEAGVYQRTEGQGLVPQAPQSVCLRPFAGLDDITRFRAPPPPATDSEEFEEEIEFQLAKGGLNSTSRTDEERDIAYFWEGPPAVYWNRAAVGVLGDRYKSDVFSSAKFFAELNFAGANAYIATWDTKYHYNMWRPITAIRHPTPWVRSGRDIHDPDWLPLLTPTPSHPEYVSGHSAISAALGQVLKQYAGDEIDFTTSVDVRRDNRGVITLSFASVSEMVRSAHSSRVYGGVHYRFSCVGGGNIGENVARSTLENFDTFWRQF